MSILSEQELKQAGFRSTGAGVRVSRKASFYNPQFIDIGDYSRIDDFCVLSAGPEGITIGAYVHIAVYSSLIGRGRIDVGNYANISSRVSVYSSTDDFSGEYMSNPTVDAAFTNVRHAPVVLEEHVIIGSGSVILPGVTLAQGCAIGALSLVNSSCAAFTVNAGVPARYLKGRSRALLEKEEAFRQSIVDKMAHSDPS